ncbi:Regulator of RpoS [subsurface metagenome]
MEKYSILLVDDDPYVLLSLSSYLRGQDYQVTEADSGEAALKKLSMNDFDLVITDLVMGQTDGIGVLKRAKQLNPTSMVMILTGYGEMVSAVDAIRLEADDYLLKPCDREEIDFRVTGCLKKVELSRKVKIYEKILPVCCVCKKIRDDAGRAPGTGKWLPLEEYLSTRAGLKVSHSYCPECARKEEEENPLLSKKS